MWPRCRAGAQYIHRYLFRPHLVAGRCGHTLKINTNNARSSIPYTPYSYTSIHWTHSLILQPELWRVKSLICTELSKIFLCTVHCVWCCLVIRKGDATAGGMSRVGILARSLPELTGVRGWVGFISNSRYHLHHQPPATTLPDILANHGNISVESSRL